MRLLKAIEMADRLCPNPYTQEEKIRWCEEVTAGIRRDVKKVYNTLTYHLSGEEKVELPDGLVFENVEAAYLDGEPLSKVDTAPLQRNSACLRDGMVPSPWWCWTRLIRCDRLPCRENST